MSKKKTDLIAIPPAETRPELITLKAKASKLIKAARSCQVADTISFEKATSIVKELVGVRKDIKAILEPDIKRAKADYDSKRKSFKGVDDVIYNAEETLRTELEVYASRQRQAQEKLIEKALTAGKDEKAAVLAAKPFVPEVQGVSFTELWHAEVVNFHDFVAWCLSGPTANLEDFLSPNLVALNARARDLKSEDLGIPGVHGVKESSSTFRR